MDSKAVNVAIRQQVWPVLKDMGFATSSRTSWRRHADRIDLVNFQSFNSYNASVIGCTTYSFAVNVGCYLLYIPEYGPSGIKEKAGLLCPHEYDCHFRGRLRRSLHQPELQDPAIWFVDTEGKYLQPALHDVRMAVLRGAENWFDQMASPERVLEILLNRREQMQTLWGFGNLPSPMRTYLTGYTALAMGRHDLAKHYLLEAAGKPSFANVAEHLRSVAESVA